MDAIPTTVPKSMTTEKGWHLLRLTLVCVFVAISRSRWVTMGHDGSRWATHGAVTRRCSMTAPRQPTSPTTSTPATPLQQSNQQAPAFASSYDHQRMPAMLKSKPVPEARAAMLQYTLLPDRPTCCPTLIDWLPDSPTCCPTTSHRHTLINEIVSQICRTQNYPTAS